MSEAEAVWQVIGNHAAGRGLWVNAALAAGAKVTLYTDRSIADTATRRWGRIETGGVGFMVDQWFQTADYGAAGHSCD